MGSALPGLPADGARRVVIESITPCVDGGRFAAKRIVGERLVVEADVFADGHDAVSCAVLHRAEHEREWQRLRMVPLGNDRWQAAVEIVDLGRHLYTVCGWVDPLETWRGDLAKKHDAGQDVSVDLARGAQLIHACAARVRGAAERELNAWADELVAGSTPVAERVARAQDATLHALAWRHPDPELVLTREPPLVLVADRERARFSSWYELFPRSTVQGAGAPAVTGRTPRHGTFRDCEARLPHIAALGFDVLYLPPIHPIGKTERKGPNNAPSTSPRDPGSPWAIGGDGGGHTAIHPELGTIDDLRRLIARAGELGIELALDIAFQCSPDHPYVREHPEWFLERPDGTIQYAENPPKKYQDIYPFHFETPAWRELWEELARVVEFWAHEGVKIFRVDNPHTKPFGLWEWLIERVKRRTPEAIFLAEAFTRPKVMYRLAKAGFTQSYTYFAWRNTRDEIVRYFTEITRPPVSDFFRANLWPNTPDILTEYLQYGGRAAFIARLVLAATLGASFGIYGPAFELMEHTAREPGSEEYLDSEKYQIRSWDLERPESLAELVALVNRIRREHPALQSDARLVFHGSDNDTLVAYSKTTPDLSDAILTIVNLDPHHSQSGWIDLDLRSLGLDSDRPFQAHDLLSGARFLWRGARNFILLDPAQGAAHVLHLKRRVRSERDFDYFG
ncbi:MAG TPA: alpha-1,4-glucan--maltose-1-phosphate maltosyltransferase [Steroidobacteraceae bacterium]|nr:alpha-1,4-glucan--maltose-1-phosphate maltosyltransferase [Steroidobacteraceae bacterium]